MSKGKDKMKTTIQVPVETRSILKLLVAQREMEEMTKQMNNSKYQPIVWTQSLVIEDLVSKELHDEGLKDVGLSHDVEKIADAIERM